MKQPNRTPSRRILRLVLLIATASLLVVGPVPVAGATTTLETGPPDASGNWAYCTVGWLYPTVTGGTTLGWEAACEYGPTSGVVTTLQLTFDDGAGGHAILSGCATGSTCSEGAGGAAVKVSKNSAGLFRETDTETITFTPLNVCLTQYKVASSASASTNYYSQTNANNKCSATPPTGSFPKVGGSITSGTLSVAYPDKYWSGGTPGSATTDLGSLVVTTPDTTTKTNGTCSGWWDLPCELLNGLKNLVLPNSGQLAGDWSVLQSTLSSKYPFGPVYWVGDELYHVVYGAQTGVEASLVAEGSGGSYLGCNGLSVKLPSFTAPGSDSSNSIEPFNTCDGSTFGVGGKGNTIRTFVNAAVSILVIFGTIIAASRAFAYMTGMLQAVGIVEGKEEDA